jgi:hypothetical protein
MSIYDNHDTDDSIDINDICNISNLKLEPSACTCAEVLISPQSKIKIPEEKKKLKVEQFKKTSGRTVMYLNDDDAKPVTAAGAVFYKNRGGKMMVLIMENDNKYEDIGGKIDPDDLSIQHTAGREIEEETNGCIMMDNLMDRLQIAQYVYVPASKYVIFII